MKFNRCSYHKFSVVFAESDRVFGLTIRRKNTECHVVDSVEVPVEEDHTGSAVRTAAKKLGVSRDRILIFSMALPDAVFLNCRVGNIASKYLHDTLELELSNRMLKELPDHLFQYAVPQKKEADETIGCNVYAFTSSAQRKAEAVIMQGLSTVDHFIYPLMGITETSPAVYLPGIEKDFYFSGGEWKPVSMLPSDWLDSWKKFFSSKFSLAPDFDTEKYLPCLLIADFVFSETFSANVSALQILPKKLYTGRYRRQLIVMGILVLILAVTGFFKGFSKLNKERIKFVSLQGEIASLQRRNRKAQMQLKASDKELRDQTRVVELNAGEADLLGKLAVLSKALPKDVMIISFRLSESGIDLVMRSEAENFNLQKIIAPLNIWKVASVRQFRRGNEAAGTIMAKLVPVEEGGRKK